MNVNHVIQGGTLSVHGWTLEQIITHVVCELREKKEDGKNSESAQGGL